MMPRRKPFRPAALACHAALLGLMPALATSAPAFEEVVVIARRQAVPRLETPLSIDRIAGEANDLLGATHSSEAINRVPGAMIQRGSGQESLTAIRSPVLTGAGSCGAFLILENGVPIRPTGFCNVNELFELDTEQADGIEVLRGTGTALYGSNAVHGTINVLQDEPSRLPRAEVSVDAGPSQYGRVGVVTGRNGARYDTGLKAMYTHDGGWRDASGFDEAKLVADAITTLRRAAQAVQFVCNHATACSRRQTTGALPNQCRSSASAATSPTITSAGDLTAASRPIASSSSRVASSTRCSGRDPLATIATGVCGERPCAMNCRRIVPSPATPM
jgi:outer membrane receptor for Fe3+-dicitrate